MIRVRNFFLLQVVEIYKSVQGESSFAGLPCTFIRLSGCPLRCRWCDTVYGFKPGRDWTLEKILQEVRQLNVPLVELTGGEPLAQRQAIELLQSLVDEGFQVLIETSGALSIAEVPKGVTVVMDLKCPGSEMSDRNLWSNLKYLKPSDEIKFVVANRSDFDWAADIIRERNLSNLCQVLISPAWGLVKPADLVGWILESQVKARLNLQLHKYIWSPRKKGV